MLQAPAPIGVDDEPRVGTRVGKFAPKEEHGSMCTELEVSKYLQNRHFPFPQQPIPPAAHDASGIAWTPTCLSPSETVHSVVVDGEVATGAVVTEVVEAEEVVVEVVFGPGIAVVIFATTGGTVTVFPTAVDAGLVSTDATVLPVL